MIGKPIFNFILLVFSIPLENPLTILPQLSLIKAMAIMTFISFAFHRKDFINFLVGKLILNKLFISFWAIFVIATLLALDKGNILSAFTNWLMWFLILAYVWYVYEKSPNAIASVEISFIVWGFGILFLIFFIQGITQATDRLMLRGYLTPTELSSTFTCLTIITISLWAKSKLKRYLFISLIFGIIVLLTGNRSIPIGFAIFMILYLFFYSKIKKIRLIISVTLPIILFIILPFQRDSFLFNIKTRIVYSFQQMVEMIIHGETAITEEEEDYHTSIYRSSRIDSDQRNRMFKEAMEIVKRNLILGVGPGSRIFSRRWEKIAGIQRAVHSNVSEILIYYGVVGFSFYLFIVFWFLRYGYKHSSTFEGKVFCFTLVIFFVDGFFHGNYIDSVVVLILAMTGFKVRRSPEGYEHQTLNEAATV